MSLKHSFPGYLVDDLTVTVNGSPLAVSRDGNETSGNEFLSCFYNAFMCHRFGFNSLAV
jgi:hypothetical protein